MRVTAELINRRDNQLGAKEPTGLQRLRVTTAIASISRAELFGGLFLLGCVNGLAGRIGQTITHHDGWVIAILSTFKISVIIFAACFIGVSLVFRGGLRTGRGRQWTRRGS